MVKKGKKSRRVKEIGIKGGTGEEVDGIKDMKLGKEFGGEGSGGGRVGRGGEGDDEVGFESRDKRG